MSLGETPLANALLRADQLEEPETRYPLDLVFCPDCALVKITETVPPEMMFTDDYVYHSSVSDALLRHAETLARHMIDTRGLD